MTFSTSGTILQEPPHLLFVAEPHHALDAGAVVPAAIEDDDFARGREVPHVALDVHLALLALGRRGQRDDPEHARTHALGDGLDRATFSRAVATFEHDADLEALCDDPLLELHQLNVQALELFVVILARELVGFFGAGFVAPFPFGTHARFSSEKTS